MPLSDQEKEIKKVRATPGFMKNTQSMPLVMFGHSNPMLELENKV